MKPAANFRKTGADWPAAAGFLFITVFPHKTSVTVSVITKYRNQSTLLYPERFPAASAWSLHLRWACFPQSRVQRRSCAWAWTSGTTAWSRTPPFPRNPSSSASSPVPSLAHSTTSCCPMRARRVQQLPLCAHLHEYIKALSTGSYCIYTQWSLTLDLLNMQCSVSG